MIDSGLFRNEDSKEPFALKSSYMAIQKKSLEPSSNNSEKTAGFESLISYLIVGLLCLIAFGVYQYHFNFNPAVLALEEIRITPQIITDVQDQKPDLPLIPPENFSVFSPPETFDHITLSDKIDGKAELYLPAGFKSLFAQRLKPQDRPEVWYEVFIYDMENMLNAFSVYSAQRRDNAEPEPFAEFAYSAENALFWVHGPFYAEIIASEVSENTREHLLALAESFNSKNPISVEPIKEIRFFPEDGLVENSMTFIPANAFGFESLNRVFAARYQDAGKELTAFISRRNSFEEATEKAEEFVQFLITYGGMEVSSDSTEINARIVEFFGTFDAVVTVGPYLAGVHEASSPETAKIMVQLIHEKLEAEQ
jgi:hypothetical protein